MDNVTAGSNGSSGGRSYQGSRSGGGETTSGIGLKVIDEVGQTLQMFQI